MNNLWILTEEKPKTSVIKQILELYQKDFSTNVYFTQDIKIKPIIENNIFKFQYKVLGINVDNINEILIKTVSGNSSFLDFLVFQQEKEPIYGINENLIMAIEETKTSDDESRNTGVYQRASKFVYIDAFYQNVKLYMLYNEELEARETKKPSDTSIFGTNMLLTIGVNIVGKNISKWFQPFSSLEELINFKSSMRKPPAGNVPINIRINDNKIEVSGRLSKPADAGNIGHDPNIGALSIIAKCLRHLGWKNEIIITQHGISQSYINKTKGKNKFLYICKLLNISLQDIVLPNNIILPEKYWHYEMSSEKVASILLHITAEYNNLIEIYQNHAGCERGYFKTKEKKLIALPKKDRNNINLYIPDLILYDEFNNEILLIEGKKLVTLKNGLDEIENYDSIEYEFILPNYPNAKVVRWITIFGGKLESVPHSKVLLYLSENGKIIINDSAPNSIKQAFTNLNN